MWPTYEYFVSTHSRTRQKHVYKLTLYLHLLLDIFRACLYVYSNSVGVSLVGEETNSVWNLVSLWVHGWVPPDWYKYPEYCAQPKHPHKADIQHYIEKGTKLHNVTKCCEPSLATQDTLGHCFIGSLDTRMWRREGSEESSNHSQGSDWSVGQRGQFRYRSKNLLVLNRILLIKKRICVNAEKLVDKVAASLISNLLQGRKTLSSKISTAVKFIWNQDNFS